MADEYYCSREDVEDVYGGLNIADWSDVNGNENPTEIESRITWARRKAYNRINGRLRNRNYTIPFDVYEEGVTTPPPEVRDIAAELSGYYLYNARMLDSSDRSKNNLMHMNKNAEEVLNQIIRGEVQLSDVLNDYTDAPAISKSSE